MLFATQEIAGAQDVCRQGMQRCLASTLAEAGNQHQHRTASPAEEFDIVQVRREVPNVPGQNKTTGASPWGSSEGYCPPYRPKPEAMQELPLGVGESYLVGMQAEDPPAPDSDIDRAAG